MGIMKEDYPLECNYCNKRELVKNRKIYQVEISEILLSGDETHPYKGGHSRFMQICEHCFKHTALNEVLHKEHREFK